MPGSDLTDVGNYAFLHSGGLTKLQGVALLLNSAMSKALISWTPISSRLLTARLRHKHGALTVVVAYVPSEAADTKSKDVFYDQLFATISSAFPHDLLFVLGDLNAKTGSDRVRFPDVVGNYGSGTVNDNSERMLSLRRPWSGRPCGMVQKKGQLEVEVDFK